MHDKFYVTIVTVCITMPTILNTTYYKRTITQAIEILEYSVGILLNILVFKGQGVNDLYLVYFLSHLDSQMIHFEN